MSIKLTGQEAQDVVLENHEDWEIIVECIVDQDKWSNFYETICLHNPTNKYYEFTYDTTSETLPYQDELKKVIEIPEVQQVEKVVKSWERMK